MRGAGRAGRKVRGALSLVALLAVVVVPAARPAPAGEFRLTVAVEGERTLVRSSPAGIACGARCSAVFPAGTIVRLTLVRVDPSFWFERWGGECVGDLRTCLVVVDGRRNVRLVLHRNQVGFGVSVGGPGRVRSSPAGIDCGVGHDLCEGSFGQGTKLALTATSGAAAAFATWGAPCGKAARCVLRVPAEGFATATFRHVYQYAVAKSGSGQGDVTCQPSCAGALPSDQVVTATATAQPGSRFDGWSGACSGLRPVCRFASDGAAQATATFSVGEPSPPVGAVPLVVTSGGSGRISGGGIDCGSTCATAVASGTVVRLSAKPTASSVFVGWDGDCSGKAACELTMDGPKSVGAVFRRLYVVSSQGPAISVPRAAGCRGRCKRLFPSDTLVTLSAPAPPTTVDWFGGDCHGVGPKCRVVSDAELEIGASVSQARSVKAGLTGYGINVSVSGRGTVVSKDGSIRCGYKSSVVDGCHASFEPGATVELQALPAKGARFVGWKGFCVGTGVCRLKMTATKTVYAIFGR